MIKIKQSLRDKAVKTVSEAFNTAEEARKPYDILWDECDKLARCSDGRKHLKKHAWQSKFFIPYTQAILDLIFPRLAGRRSSAHITARYSEYDKSAHKFDELVKYQQDKMDIDLKFANWVYESLVFGTSFAKLTWKKETGDNLNRTQGTIDKIKKFFAGFGVKLGNEDFLYDGPYFENVSPYDIFLSPKGTSINDIDAVAYLIHRTEETKADLRKNSNYNAKAINSIKGAGDDIEKFRKDRLTSRGLSGSSYSDLQETSKDKYIEILEYWGLFDIDGDGIEEECIITIANRKTLLRLEENPYYHAKKPFIDLRYLPDPGFFYGKGVVERIKHLQYELNDIRNHRMDQRLMSLHTIRKVVKEGDIDLEAFAITPNAIWPVTNKDDVEVIKLPFDGASFENEELTVKKDMQMATGATDVVVGGESVGLASDTAKGAMIASEQSSLRFRIPLLMIDNAIRRFGEMLIALNKQFFDNRKGQRLQIKTPEGQKEITIYPKDIQGHYEYVVSQGTMSPDSPQTKREKVLAIKQLYGQDKRFDQTKLDREIFNAFDMDIDDFRSQQPTQTQELDTLSQLSPQEREQALSQLSPEQRKQVEQEMI